MCCLFGMIDYGKSLSGKQKSRMISVLATECEARGTDATGIAYNHGGLQIHKRPLPAHQMRFFIPDDVRVILGHTRQTTQGSEKRNKNNHPFEGNVLNSKFALAHNGILYNDRELKLSHNLPKTSIETDSYVAVQLIEKKNALDFDSLKFMAEQVEGSFVFTVLDEKDGTYFVKGDNPLCIYHYPKLKLYLYASTQEILDKAIRKMPIKGEPERINIRSGDIIGIDASGNISRSEFEMNNIFSYHYLTPYSYPYPAHGKSRKDKKKYSAETQQYIEDLKSVACYCGYEPEIIDDFLDEGFTLDEMVDMLYHGEM